MKWKWIYFQLSTGTIVPSSSPRLGPPLRFNWRRWRFLFLSHSLQPCSPSHGQTEVVHWLDPSHRCDVKDLTMVCPTARGMSQSPLFRSEVLRAGGSQSFREVLEFLHVVFIFTSLRIHKYTPEVTEMIIDGHRPSTLHHYQSCWKKFQEFVQKRKFSSSSFVLEFLRCAYIQK